jgi:hypothetical protein
MTASHPLQCGQLVTPGLPKSGPRIMSALQAAYGQYRRSSAGRIASAACQPCNKHCRPLKRDVGWTSVRTPHWDAQPTCCAASAVLFGICMFVLARSALSRDLGLQFMVCAVQLHLCAMHLTCAPSSAYTAALQLLTHHVQQGRPLLRRQQAAQRCHIHLVPAVRLRAPGKQKAASHALYIPKGAIAVVATMQPAG